MASIAKRIAVLGSTGSIGRQTLDVVRAFPDRLQVVALAAGNNQSLLAAQVAEFKPEIVSLDHRGSAGAFAGAELRSLEDVASCPGVDLVVLATAGKAGLAPALAAIRAGKTIALANKEVLVIAGAIVTEEARRHGVKILPVDSEHSAIWQCLRGESPDEILRLILTASGGPFRNRSLDEMARVTPAEALNHPTWLMGKKVTIDSATLMNKGMEIIEAHWLFDLPFSKIEVVVHPQSIIHSMVEFVDGSTKAQLSRPDMRFPIQCALSHPQRWAGPFRGEYDVAAVSELTLEPVDVDKFPCLKLAREAGARGDTYPAVLSAADEVAVDLFLSGRISLTGIAGLVARTLEQHKPVSRPSIQDILEADAWARQTALDGF